MFYSYRFTKLCSCLLGLVVLSSLIMPAYADAREPLTEDEIANLLDSSGTATALSDLGDFNQGRDAYDYLLGAGDQVSIEIVGYPEFSSTYMVLPDGTIVLPLIGAVRADGRTLSGLSQVIENQLGSAYLVNPVVNLSLLSLRPISIALSGEVNRPGPFQFDVTQNEINPPTLVDALIGAGGVTNFADIREITVRRSQSNGQTETIVLNFWNSLVSEPGAVNLSLRDGDYIIVPRLSANEQLDQNLIARSTIAPDVIRVKVVGEVQSPGEVQISPISTLSSAIATAGGPTDDAKLSKVTFIRMDENENVTSQEIDLRNLTDTIQVQDGDVIVVPKKGVATGLDLAARLLNPLRFFTDIWRILD